MKMPRCGPGLQAQSRAKALDCRPGITQPLMGARQREVWRRPTLLGPHDALQFVYGTPAVAGGDERDRQVVPCLQIVRPLLEDAFEQPRGFGGVPPLLLNEPEGIHCLRVAGLRAQRFQQSVARAFQFAAGLIQGAKIKPGVGKPGSQPRGHLKLSNRSARVACASHAKASLEISIGRVGCGSLKQTECRGDGEQHEYLSILIPWDNESASSCGSHAWV